ncbi:MAG: hypothetical protein IRY99_22170 [Isosphaeraceae bacterium]|nr:hypothetical protein [Isosphaeraceae bacterium]
MTHEPLRSPLRWPCVLVLAALAVAGCLNTEPTAVLQFPAGTKPQEPIPLKAGAAVDTGGGVMSVGDPSDYTKPPGSP